MKIITVSFLLCALLVIPQFQTDVEAACQEEEDKYACVKHKNGQFRLVCDPSDCNPSEYPLKYEVNDDGDLELETCWTNTENEDCILKLKFNSDDSFFSIIGSEICNGDIKEHVYGSGFSNSDGGRIGLTFTGIGSHEGKVFLDDLKGLCDASGETCPDKADYAYTPVACGEPE